MLPQCFKSRSDSNPGLNYDDAHNTEKNAVDIPNEFLKNIRVWMGQAAFYYLIENRLAMKDLRCCKV